MPRMHGTWRLSTNIISIGVMRLFSVMSASLWSRTRRHSPLAALRSKCLWGTLLDLGPSVFSNWLLQIDTADPVSRSALTMAPPTEIFTIGRFSPEYVIDVNRLRQVSRHWGKALPSTFPRDRFPTPDSVRGRLDPNVRSIGSLHIPNLGDLDIHCDIPLTCLRWGIGGGLERDRN